MMLYLLALVPIALIITLWSMRGEMKQGSLSHHPKKNHAHTAGTIVVLEDGPKHYR